MSDEELINEAMAINHSQFGVTTRYGYAICLRHFSEYLSSLHGATFYTARRRHVLQYLKHLEEPASPEAVSEACRWCRRRQQRGTGVSPSRRGVAGSARSKHLSAIKALYRHFLYEEDLPDIDPSQYVKYPRRERPQRYTPTEEEVARLLRTPCLPTPRLAVRWVYFAPARRASFVEARWRDLDLTARTWTLIGKNGKRDEFALHPVLVTELHRYKAAQRFHAEGNALIAAALADPETAYVLLTANGTNMHASQLNLILKRHAIQAGVGVIQTGSYWVSADGRNSRLTAHSLRRAWATHALEHGVPIDVVQAVLAHAEIRTTQEHYAHIKPERARAALLSMPLPGEAVAEDASVTAAASIQSQRAAPEIQATPPSLAPNASRDDVLLSPVGPSSRQHEPLEATSLPVEPTRADVSSTAQQQASDDGRSLTHWLVLGLLIEQPSHGYELSRRYDQRFTPVAAVSAARIYAALDRLRDRGLIEAVALDPTKVARKQQLMRRPYRASEEGVHAYRRWVSERMHGDPERAQLLARIASTSRMGPDGILEVIDSYESMCVEELRRVPPADAERRKGSDLSDLTDVLLAEQRRTELRARLDWAARARQIVKATLTRHSA
ncbi:MAG: tyrosine-type recombinase/integrase [Solirubrobacteraceae bacterium]